MTPDDTTRPLAEALDGMRDKSRALNDSLKTLADDGFEKLARSVGKAATTAPAPRRDSTDIATDALGKFLRGSLSSGLKDLFGGIGQTRGGGSGGMQVIIHNNTAAQVTARESGDGFDQKYLEITIDQMVANSLLRGRQTSGILRSLFGLTPSLIGR